jgi:hypothetical protein
MQVLDEEHFPLQHALLVLMLQVWPFGRHAMHVFSQRRVTQHGKALVLQLAPIPPQAGTHPPPLQCGFEEQQSVSAWHAPR